MINIYSIDEYDQTFKIYTPSGYKDQFRTEYKEYIYDSGRWRFYSYCWENDIRNTLTELSVEQFLLVLEWEAEYDL